MKKKNICKKPFNITLIFCFFIPGLHGFDDRVTQPSAYYIHRGQLLQDQMYGVGQGHEASLCPTYGFLRLRLQCQDLWVLEQMLQKLFRVTETRWRRRSFKPWAAFTYVVSVEYRLKRVPLNLKCYVWHSLGTLQFIKKWKILMWNKTLEE